jgi:hypothetical protein
MLKEPLQGSRAKGLPPRPQDHLVRAGNGIDAIHLHKADAVDQIMQRLSRGRAGRPLGQRMAVKEQKPRGTVLHQVGHSLGVSLQKVSENAGFVSGQAAGALDKCPQLPTIPLSPDKIFESAAMAA